MKSRFRRYMPIPANDSTEAQIVRIAGDAAIATSGTVHGRIIPLVILDTTERQDLVEVIRVQVHFSEGDVKVAWGKLQSQPNNIALLLQFLRPIERTAIIAFEMPKHGTLIEHALMSHALYLQAGKPGDTLIHDIDLPKMLVEIPDTGFRKVWDRLYLQMATREARARGLDRRTARSAAKQYVELIRSVARFQIKEPPAVPSSAGRSTE